jgi:hypothetical protein
MEQHRQGSSKNILNEKKIKSTNAASGERKAYPILVESNDGEIVVRIKKDYADSANSYDIVNLITLSLSSVFTNKNKSLDVNNHQHHPKNNFPHIAFFIESFAHYTGGRYSLYHQAILMSQITPVTVITNQSKFIFSKDFEKYESERFKVISNSSGYLMGKDRNDFDIIVGIPHTSGIMAHQYAKKWNLPLYMVLFESPNWISKYRDGADSKEEYWKSYKRCMMDADVILVPSYESRKWLIDWDVEFSNKKIEVIYPCVNELEARNIKPSKDGKKNIVFISRMAAHKKPFKIIKELSRKYTTHIIGKVQGDNQKVLNDMVEKEGCDIVVHNKINDKNKFQLIANSDLVVFPTYFEGYGMPPMEAIYMGKQVLTYDLPVLKEVYGDNVHYVSLGNEDEFVKKANDIVSKKIKHIECDEDFVDRFSCRRCLSDLRKTFGIPKITAGIIVYNGADYLHYAVKSIYHLLSEIIIVEGCVKGYSDKPVSDDGTLDVIDDMMNKDWLRKIIYVSNDGKFWSNKVQMQNEIAKRVTGKYYLKLDADEIWKPETLMDVIDTLEKDNNLWFVRMAFYHFWLSFKRIAVDDGAKWSTYHPRIWRWDKRFRHSKSFNFFICDLKNGKSVKVDDPNYASLKYDEDRIYHFGYVRKLSTLQQKINYYKTRGIEKVAEDTVTNWKEGMRTQPTQNKDSSSKLFDKELPEVLNDHPYKDVDDIRTITE